MKKPHIWSLIGFCFFIFLIFAISKMTLKESFATANYEYLGTFSLNGSTGSSGATGILPYEYPESISTVHQASRIASGLGANMYGIYAGNTGGNLYYGYTNADLNNATQYSSSVPCDSSMGCSGVGKLYLANNYNYVGAFNDNPSPNKALPYIYNGNITSQRQAVKTAYSLGASVFGLQQGATGTQFYYGYDNDIPNATMFGSASCTKPLGCSNINQVWQLNNT